MISALIEVIRSTIMITSFVLVIMLIIEYINVQTKGDWLKFLKKYKWLQYPVSGLIGIIPGCVGGFAVVSMYIHKLVSFGALITALIAGFGDEAFVMLALIPLTTIKLSLIILLIGIVAGIIVDFVIKRKSFVPPTAMELELHNEETVKHKVFDATNILSNLKRISFPRGSLLGGLSLIIFGIFTNQFNEGPGHQAWDWEQVSFLVIMLAGLFIILAVSEHFLESHLWGHVVKKHFLKILLWTFGALLLIELFKSQINIDNWVKSNQLIILFLAVIIGIIPESGPHLVFVTLYINHAIPFSILLASSIVQDGHASLPLLAESKKGFFIAKGINILIGLLVGLAGMYIFEN
jgi:hypothetical protein